jgi:mannose-6-phosphate isomerase-like protein (cupin superfamily)
MSWRVRHGWKAFATAISTSEAPAPGLKKRRNALSFADRLLLPLRFDADGLAADARGLPEDAWERHFNADYYEGDWSGVALRSTANRVALYPDPNDPGGFCDTPLLAACPHVRDVLATFRCLLNSVRFLRLGPGARVREHRDYGLEFSNGEARMHVPVVTGPGVEFVLAGTQVPMRAGECWYVDVNRPHSVANPGASPRVHLVVDCVVNDWLREVMTGHA